MLAKSINLLFVLFLSTSCLKTEPDSNSNKPTPNVTSSPSSNKNITRYLSKVKSVDARTVYSLTLDKIRPNVEKVLFTFRGHHKPTLTLYKNEIKAGKKIHLFPPSFKYKNLFIESYGQDHKLKSKTLIKLNSKKNIKVRI